MASSYDDHEGDVPMPSAPSTPPLPLYSGVSDRERRRDRRSRSRSRSPHYKRRRNRYDSYRPEYPTPRAASATTLATTMREYTPPRFSRLTSRSDGPPKAPPRPSNAPRVDPNPVLGVFGLSIRTRERDLEDEFSRFGEVDHVTIVYDQRTDRSRGFGFVTMRETEDATQCIENLNGMVLHGRPIRVDYSATHKAHAPTPGEYKGERRPFDDRYYRGNGRYRGDRSDDRRGGFDRGWGGGDRGSDRWVPNDRNGSWRDRDGPGGPPRRDADDPYGGRSRRDDDRGDKPERNRSPSPPRRPSTSPERRPEVRPY